ncbi:MAG: hypothetical protein ACTSO7_13430 [Candidatus Heimdallarchaeota archaeon]
MHIILLSFIIAVIFGTLATLVVWIARREVTPAMGIVGGGAFVGGFLIALAQLWWGMPSVATIILVVMLVAGIGMIVLLRIFSRNFGRLGRSPEKIIVLIIAAGLIITPAAFGIGTAIYKGFNQAKYFDSILTFTDEKEPFSSLITSEHLRVVDSDLAAELILKSSPFGSNTMILELHIGVIDGDLMWIGAIGTDAIRVGTDNEGRKRNTIFGFAGVDLTDPQVPVKVINQTFEIGHYLARTKTLNRQVWKINPNYIAGYNTYFSMNPDGEMRLLVPYSITQSWKTEAVYGIGMTTYLEKLGGVLEFDASGALVKDHKDLTTLPDYARIQCYSEDWLEYSINKWGKHRKGNHEFAYYFTTSEQLGISPYDDVRVIYDPSTDEISQYVMLTQPDSESQLLRGAIKANSTGIYFFDWSDVTPKPIDTNSAIRHCETKLLQVVGYPDHNYYPILPLLFPIRETFGNLSDYAYVVPLQFDNLRFGGVCITDPFDAGGSNTWVEVADEPHETVAYTLAEAIEQYLLNYGGEIPATSNETSTLKIDAMSSFIKDGNTIFVAFGNLTYVPEGNITSVSENTTVWFTQTYLNVTQWQIVLFLNVNDTIELEIVYLNDVFYCKEIYSVF